MKRLSGMLSKTARGLFDAVYRFPLTVLCLLGAAYNLCYMVWIDREPSLFIQKLMFTFLFGAILGAAAQIACERFGFVSKKRAAVFLISAAAALGYYLILMPIPEINMEVTVRTFVAIFAMLCAFLWLPSFKGRANFNAVCLTSFKFIFTSILYAGVIWIGTAAIIAAIDSLLFSIDNDAYLYMSIIIWVLFAPIYYLSLLPKFNSSDSAEIERAEHAARCPKYLEILISYILIPLITIYTAVLAAYFIKILFTLKWPSGQLGYMVLLYSAAGLIIYVLASLLENNFAIIYRKLFPKVLIPVVIMQLISVGIRLKAYAVTESRYYVTLFGLFSLVCAVILSFKPVNRNGIIALLAAGFAIFSVVPPVDAFTVSRQSQTARVESMLASQGMLQDGKLTPKSDVPNDIKKEVTNILQYLSNRRYTDHIKWLPERFDPYSQMKSVIGFEPYYGPGTDGELTSIWANLDMRQPLDISGCDVFLSVYSNIHDGNQLLNFDIDNSRYMIEIARVSSLDTKVSVKNAAGDILVSTLLYDQAKKIAISGGDRKDMLPPENMTFSVENNGYTLRIVFQNIFRSFNTEERADYTFYAMFGVPK